MNKGEKESGGRALDVRNVDRGNDQHLYSNSPSLLRSDREQHSTVINSHHYSPDILDRISASFMSCVYVIVVATL
jgi:hypothetical protein